MPDSLQRIAQEIIAEPTNSTSTHIPIKRNLIARLRHLLGEGRKTAWYIERSPWSNISEKLHKTLDHFFFLQTMTDSPQHMKAKAAREIISMMKGLCPESSPTIDEVDKMRRELAFANEALDRSCKLHGQIWDAYQQGKSNEEIATLVYNVLNGRAQEVA